jgi:hypothetical protein
MSENVGTSNSRNRKGLHGLYRDNFTFYPYMTINNKTWALDNGVNEGFPSDESCTAGISIKRSAYSLLAAGEHSFATNTKFPSIAHHSKL